MNRRAACLLAAALLGGVAAAPASTPGEGGGERCGASAAPDDDRTIDLNEPKGHFAYLELEDDEPGPPPAVGHWNTFLPRNANLPDDADRLLVATAPELGGTPPTFAGTVVGELRTIFLQLSRGLAVDTPPQLALVVTLVVDDAVLLDDAIPVSADASRLDVCHLAHFGGYYAVLADVDAALRARGLANDATTEHRVSLSFAPSGQGEGVPPIEVFGIDAQASPSLFQFNGPTTFGPITRLG